MTMFSSNYFMQNYKIKNDTMIESELQRVFKYPNYPRVSRRATNKTSGTIDDGQMGGTHWTCYYIKDDKSFYFVSFGGQLDKFLLNQ